LDVDLVDEDDRRVAVPARQVVAEDEPDRIVAVERREEDRAVVGEQRSLRRVVRELADHVLVAWAEAPDRRWPLRHRPSLRPTETREPGSQTEPGSVTVRIIHAMNFELSEEQQLIRETARSFCARELAPHTAEWDRNEAVDRAVVGKLAALGFLAAALPE